MKRLIVLAVLAGGFTAVAAERKPTYTLKPVPYNPVALTPSEVFEKVKDSVVVIKTLGGNGKTIGQGSGVLLPAGKIGTNCHVLKHGERFLVGSARRFVPGILWGSDEEKDICLLEAKGLGGKPAQLGQATRLRVGEPVYAVGAPRGLELSLSDGIVSQLRGGPPPFIQTTAAISPGSSGGGLFNAEGQLVGFTTLYIEGGQSLNFALPVEWVGEILQGRKAAQERSFGDWNKRAEALISAKNWKGLRDWSRQWALAQPGHSAPWQFLGFAYSILDLPSDAVDAYRKMLRIDPEDTTAWSQLGSNYIKLQRYTEALDAYRQAVRINPKNALHWDGLGNSYSNLQRYAEAVQAYRQALSINPIDVIATGIWYNLGLTYYYSGDSTAALQVVQQLRRLDPAKADELFSLIVPR